MNEDDNKIDENEYLRVLDGWTKDPDGDEWEPYMQHSLLSLLIYIKENKMDLKNTSVQELLNIIFDYIQKEIIQEAEDREIERQEIKEGMDDALQWICGVIEQGKMDTKNVVIQDLIDVLFDIRQNEDV